MARMGFHSIFVPIPIALLIGAFAADLAFWGTGDPVCAEAALWLARVALGAAAVSIVASLIDGSRSEACAGAAALLLVFIDVAMRAPTGAAPSLASGLFLTALAAAILILSGAMGAEHGAEHHALSRAFRRRARTLDLRAGH